MLREYGRILVDQGKGAAQDRRSRAPILFEHHPLGVGKMAVKQFECRTRCSAKTVDGLIGIADGKDVSFRASQAGENLDLGEVGVLKFVGENETGLRPRFGQNRFVVVQQCMRSRDHVAEGTEILFLQPALHRREHAGDLAAAAQNLLVLECDFRLHNTWDRDFLAFEAIHVLGVFFRRDQFVVTAADKIEQIVQKLADVGGADVVLEMQFANAAAKVDPEIFVVEDAEVFVDALEQFEAVVVKGRGVYFPAANQLADAVTHLAGGVDGIGQREDLVRLGMTFVDQALDTVGQDRGLAGARAGDHQHRSVNVLDGFSLAIIWSERNGAGIRLRWGHPGSGYHLRETWKEANRWHGS